LNAASSTDVDGDVLTYAWDFGDLSSGVGVQTSHAYAADGTYPVTLTVSDGVLNDVITQNVTVAASGPVGDIECGVDYNIVNVGDTQFQVELNITNNAASSVKGYSLSWALGAGESFGSGWNGTFSTAGDMVTVTNEESTWNGTIAPSGSSTVGFIITKSAGALPTPQTAFGGFCSSETGGGGGGPGAAYACGIDPTTVSSTDDWLTTNGNQVVDSDGNSVWLAGANWFGMNATERVFHGLWSANMEELVSATAQRGINVIRVPISTQLLLEWQAGQFDTVSVNLSANPNLEGKNSLEIFDHFLLQAKSCGVKVIMDIHGAEADNSGHIAPLWYKGTVTTDDWVSTIGWLATRYAGDDTIIAYDLENEPHGVPTGTAASQQQAGESDFDYCNRLPEATDNGFAKWDDSTDINNWKYAAELGAAAVLNANPNALILIEGTEVQAKHGKWVNPSKVPNQPEPCYSFNWWGGNLKGVAEYEVLAPAGLQDQIMYSPHDYGPAVYMQGWFKSFFDRDTLRADVWEPNWLYIHNEGISPLLIGEWGGFMDGGINQKWMEALRDEIAALKLHHTFWVINPNSGDTGGLVLNDWVTWDEEKYALLKPALWQEGGQFVGLDKVVPIGGTAGTGVTRPAP